MYPNPTWHVTGVVSVILESNIYWYILFPQNVLKSTCQIDLTAKFLPVACWKGSEETTTATYASLSQKSKYCSSALEAVCMRNCTYVNPEESSRKKGRFALEGKKMFAPVAYWLQPGLGVRSHPLTTGDSNTSSSGICSAVHCLLVAPASTVASNVAASHLPVKAQFPGIGKLSS
jgi:hypothetical protein